MQDDGRVGGKAAVRSRWRRYTNGVLAAEISTLSRYCDRVVQWRPNPADTGLLLEKIDCPDKQVMHGELPDLREAETTDLILLNGNLNHSLDIQALLTEIKQKLNRRSRIVLVAYNPYYRWLYSLANKVGLRRGEEPSTFVTLVDLEGLVKLAGFEITRYRSAAFVPWRSGGLGTLANYSLPAIPGVRDLSLAKIIVLRPVLNETRRPSLSVVIPARNERGNIEPALQRLQMYDDIDLEIIFVEGHSTDGTWEEIQRVLPRYADRFTLAAYQQSGKGKVDAVRLGFSHATGELLTILDADLTMPPEMLGRFYECYCAGQADFVNGSRLVYPMEGEAMRFLNRLGNTFFAKTLSSVLGARLGDSLCGTKLLRRSDYERMIAWRRDFGDFDPFGDFELLFPAAVLGLGIVDIPVRYAARTYGSTNISRFRHGAVLLKMTLTGLAGITTGPRGRCGG